MSRQNSGPPPNNIPPGFFYPEYPNGYGSPPHSNLPPPADGMGWYMNPPVPTQDYGMGSHPQDNSASHQQHGSASEKKRSKLGYHRTSVACSHCRRRKIRCVPSPSDVQGRCVNCIRLKKECSFIPTDQQTTDSHVKLSSQSSEAGIPSNASSPGPVGAELNLRPSKRAPPALASRGIPQWSQVDLSDGEEPYAGTQADNSFDFDEHSAQGFPLPGQNPYPDPHSSRINDHWRRQAGSPEIGHSNAFMAVGWGPPMPMAPIPYREKPPTGPQTRNGVPIPPVPGPGTHTPPTFTSAGGIPLGPPPQSLPLSYPPIPPDQVVPSNLGPWHQQRSFSGPESAYSPWMYPQHSPGHHLPEDGHSGDPNAGRRL